MRSAAVVIRTPTVDRNAVHQLGAVCLLLQAWNSVCSTVKFGLIPFLHGTGPSDWLISGGLEVPCLIWMAAMLLTGRIRWWAWVVLALTALLSSPIATICDSWPSSLDSTYIFGLELSPDHHGILGRALYPLTIVDWSMVLPITFLLSAAKKPHLHWRWLAWTWWMGRLIDDTMREGISPFMVPGRTSGDWIHWTATVTFLLMFFALMSGRGIALLALVGLLLGLANSTWDIVQEWRFMDWSRADQWFSTLPILSGVGGWFALVWFASRKSGRALPDDGSPWPRRYCAKCFYNLHGVEADRCPECGASLYDDRGEIACHGAKEQPS